MPDRERKKPVELDTLARAYTHMCIKQISGILINDPDTGRRLAAAAILLDRGWGKPKTDNTHEVKGEIKVILRQMLEDDDDG